MGETERTIQLLGSLLDLAKSNQGEISLHLILLNLNDWVQTTRWIIDPEFPRLSVEIASTPLMIQTGPEKLQQVIQQLINNAANYSEVDRPIALILSRDRQEAVIQVRDRGFGIPAAEQTHIFEPFYRLEASRCRSTGGIGLGLAIVKSLTESMGGRVTVQSTLGEGSVFEVRLPIEVAKP